MDKINEKLLSNNIKFLEMEDEFKQLKNTLRIFLDLKDITESKSYLERSKILVDEMVALAESNNYIIEDVDIRELYFKLAQEIKNDNFEEAGILKKEILDLQNKLSI